MKKLAFVVAFVFAASVYSQWTQTLNGISIWSLCAAPNGIYAGSLTSTSMLYKTTNFGMNWTPLTSGNGQTIFSIGVDSMNNIFAANFSAGLLKSTNNGANFTTMPASYFGGSSLNAVACGKRGHVYIGTNGGGFYRSIDTGNTFTPAAGLSGQQIISITVDKYNSSIVYVGTTSTSSGPNGFFRSTDYGATFSVNLNPNKNIYGILQMSAAELYTISTTAGGPFDKSTNGGLNWTTVTTGYIARGICGGLNPGEIFISGSGGVFRSTNGGANFTNQNITSSATPIQHSSGYIYAGLSGSSNGGVWIRNYFVGIQSLNETAGEFSLSQNYPNPFNPSTKIKFSLPGSGFTRLVIYDILGREVSVPVNEELKRGTYQIEWDASHFSSGVYYYKLFSGSYISVKKMILLK